MSDEEYHRQLKKFVQDVRSALSIKKSFERLVQIGRRTGLTDIQIGDDIRAEFKGELPDSTIRKYLPPSFKHQEKANLYLKHDAILVSHSQPDTFSPSQPVREAEIIPERQPQPLPRIKFNTDTFRRELRIALINGDTVWLTYNNGEVIEMKER